MSHYLHAAILWLASLSSGNRLFDPHPQTQFESCSHKKTDTHTMPSKADSEYELEMDVVGGTAAVGTTAPRAREHSLGSGGHSRSKSESSAITSEHPNVRAQEAFNTLPRRHARGNGHGSRHSRNSSYAPVVVVPGVVNSSFLLFAPESKPTNTVRRRKMQTFSEKVEERRDREPEESGGGSGSSTSRSSFDSYGSPSSASSYTSYASDEREHEHCATSQHHASYSVGDGD